jgi:hypothetical protein
LPDIDTILVKSIVHSFLKTGAKIGKVLDMTTFL